MIKFPREEAIEDAAYAMYAERMAHEGLPDVWNRFNQMIA